MIENLEINFATEDDREEILSVLQTANMHNIPSLEMNSLDLTNVFVASIGDEVVGMAGIKMISNTIAKTTLMAVLPDYRGTGIGFKLQHRRVAFAHDILKATHIKTLSDRPHVIEWYKNKFKYEETGKIDKLHEFGDPDEKAWTILMLKISDYMGKVDD